MGRVQLFSATSLDGYIARQDGGIDWLFTDADYGYSEFYAGIEAVVMGRTTYEVSLRFGGYPYPGKRAYVFSHSRAGSNDENAQFVAGDPAELVAQWKQHITGNIWLVGGSELSRDFLSAGLIDDFIVSIHPILLGNGIPLIAPGETSQILDYVGSATFPSGLVQLRYQKRAA